MHTITPPDQIIEEVKNLISYTISNREEDSDFKTMHRAIIKKYFEAKNVKINYQDHTVDLKIPVGKRQYSSITFECQDIERFIKSCLRKDEKSCEFYQSLLSHYKVTHAA